MSKRSKSAIIKRRRERERKGKWTMPKLRSPAILARALARALAEREQGRLWKRKKND